MVLGSFTKLKLPKKTIQMFQMTLQALKEDYHVIILFKHFSGTIKKTVIGKVSQLGQITFIWCVG